jgi:hypothetical protein
VNGELGDHSSQSSLPGDSLRAAFQQHGSCTGRDWTARVRRRRQEGDESAAQDNREVRVDLTAADADFLADLLQEAAELAADSTGAGASLPFIGSAEAAKLVGVEPPTIRAWVAGRGPAKQPFPRPVIQMRGRNLWRRRAVEKWKAEQDQRGGHDTGHGSHDTEHGEDPGP